MFPTAIQCLPFAAVPPGVAIDLAIGSSVFWALFGLAAAAAVIAMIGTLDGSGRRSRRVPRSGSRGGTPVRVASARA